MAVALARSLGSKVQRHHDGASMGFFPSISSFRPQAPKPAAPAPAPAKPAPPPRSPDSFEAKGSVKPKVVLNPADIAKSELGVDGNVSVDKSFGKGPVTASVKFDANLEANVKHENGMATFTVSADMSGTVSGQASIKAFTVGGSFTKGASGQYTVTMPDADFDKMVRSGSAPPNPLDPDSLPDHASVQIDKNTFTGSSFQASFEKLGATLSVGDTLKDTKGFSIKLEKNGNDLTATAGPTEAFEGTNTVGLSFGKVASVSVGSSFTDQQFKLQTATFDLGTPEGKAQASQFANTGTVPTANAPGLKNVALIEKDLDSGSGSLSAAIGPFKFSSTSDGGHANNILIHNADGTTGFQSDFNTQGIQTSVNRTLDAQGNVVPGSVSATLKFDSTDEGTRMKLLGAFSNLSPEELQKAADQKGPIEITLTQDQIKQLQVRAGQLINDKSQIGITEGSLELITDQKEFNHGNTRPEDQAVLGLTAFSGNQDQVADLLGSTFTNFLQPGFRLSGDAKVVAE
jgi:hypothetical protein